jgi:malonyl-ACP O-methyltransferase BioC
MRFGRAATGYHDTTPVQRWMATRLVEQLPRDASATAILELGCGTGHLTLELARRFPKSKLVATDLSATMLREASAIWPHEIKPPRWESLDARTPREFPIHPDLVASNAVVQWFPDLEGHLRSIRNLSAAGTVYVLSDFGRDHFPELERILTSSAFGYSAGPGHDPGEALALAKKTGWRARSLHEESRVELYASAADFLRHLKTSGVNRPPPQDRPLTRSRLQALLERLTTEAMAPGGIAITWKPWFLVLEAI